MFYSFKRKWIEIDFQDFLRAFLTYFNHVLRSEIMEFESFYTHISSWAKIYTAIFLSRLYKI